MEPEDSDTPAKQEITSASDVLSQLDPQTDATNREPAEKSSNDYDDDKTEPAPDDFARDFRIESPEKNADNSNTDVNEENDREPADLSVKNKQQEVVVSSKEELSLQSFRLDSMETAKFRIGNHRVHRESLLRSDRRPAQETGASIDFAALGIIINNNNNNNNNNDYNNTNNNSIDQAIIHQLLSNRSVAKGDGDHQAKKKRVRIRKRRSDADLSGSPGTGNISGSDTPSSGTGLASDSSSPAVILDVVCGQNQASLCIDKLRSGSKTACVLLNGTWLTPNQYQHVSGRGTARDWKRSIKHNGTSLKALLASKVLTFDPPQCRCNLCLAVTAYSKESAKHANSVDQENQPPKIVDFASGGNGKPAFGLRIPMEVLPATGAVRGSSGNATKVDGDADDDDDEEDEEEEEEEESMEGGNEEDEEEEEDWIRKRALMQAIALMELPSATAAAAAARESRKRKSVQCDVRVIKKKKSNKELSSSIEGVRASSANEAQSSDISASSSKTPEATGSTAATAFSPVGVSKSLTRAPVGLTNAAATDSSKPTQPRLAQSFQKEETLTHIIHELRNYKKSLEEKIVAGRRCSSNKDIKESTSGLPVTIQRHRNSPRALWLPPNSTTGQRRISASMDDHRGRTSEGCGRKDWTVKSTTKSEGPDEKLLPDLVRSHNPSTSIVTATSSHARLSSTTPKNYSVYATHPFSPSCLPSTCHYIPQARYVIDPQNGAKYECDEFGAIDLRLGEKSSIASLPYYPVYSRVTGKMSVDCDGDSDGEKVLDLSASSMIKVDVKAATKEGRPPKRKRLSDGHSKRLVQKQTWPACAGKILTWSSMDVVKFVTGVPGCAAYAEIFKQFGVTGTSLICLSIDQMTATLRMRFNAAQALRSAIDRLLTAPASTAGGGSGGLAGRLREVGTVEPRKAEAHQ